MFWVVLADIKTVFGRVQGWIVRRWKQICIVLGILAFVAWGLGGAYLCDNARLTGESVPMVLRAGPYVFCGTLGLATVILAALLCLAIVFLVLVCVIGAIVSVVEYVSSVWQRAHGTQQPRPA